MDNRDAHSKNLRAGRFSEPYGLYYVTKCTLNHFVLSDSQRQDTIEALLHLREQGHVLLHAFVVMPDHGHAIFSLTDTLPLSKTMEVLARRASYPSRQHGASMPAQEGFHNHKLRPAETVIDYIRYIENNPVRAGLVEQPEDWVWSSAREEYREHLDRTFLGHERWGK